MIINTFSYLWSATALQAVTELVAEGYDAFEVPVSSPHCWPDDMSAAERDGMKDLLAASGASIRSLNAGGYDINLASPGANMRRKSIDHIAAVIDLAIHWGARDVVISPGTRRPMISPRLQDSYGWMYESLGTLVPLAEEAGVRLLMENTPYCLTPTIGAMAEVVGEVDSDTLKIVYDVANAAFIREDPVLGLRDHHQHIALVHISDTGVETWGHDPIGTGVIDWTALADAAREARLLDDVVLEVIREEFPRGAFRDALTTLVARGWDLAGQNH